MAPSSTTTGAYCPDEGVLMLTVVQERSPLIIGDQLKAVTFAGNDEYLVSGHYRSVRVWRAEDGKEMGVMAAESVNCLTVSHDGRWIAAGTMRGEVIAWDTDTYGKIFTHSDDISDVNGVDFAPGSSRLVIASSNGTATVWDIATRQRVLGPLRHEDRVIAAKFSPQGERIATTTRESVRLYDSNDGRLFVDISVKVTPYYNTGLVWSKEHLFVISDSTINQIEASTGSIISERPVPTSNYISSIALSKHGEFIAYATNCTVTFWDTSTHTQLSLIQHTQNIRSIALSLDDRFLAIGGESGNITIKNIRDFLPLSYFTVRMVLMPIHLALISFDMETDRLVSQIPFIDINDVALDFWKQGRLADTEASLTREITNSMDQSHHALASRALVRVHMRDWDVAIDDAENVNLCLFPLPHTYTHSKLPQVHRDSAIRAWLHRKEYCTHPRGGKGGGLPGVRPRIQALSSR